MTERGLLTISVFLTVSVSIGFATGALLALIAKVTGTGSAAFELVATLVVLFAVLASLLAWSQLRPGGSA